MNVKPSIILNILILYVAIYFILEWELRVETLQVDICSIELSYFNF